MLQGVLVESVPCPAPEEVRPEYTKPMVLEDEVLRTLTLDREGIFSMEHASGWEKKSEFPRISI